MNQIMQMIIISVSLSIDALGIGIAYGIKKVEITKTAKAIIGCIQMIIMWIALFVGEYMNQILPPKVTAIFGISILVLMGTIFIRNSLFQDEEASYDFDHSKKIDYFEAIILGVALSADSISAGIAVASIGYGNMWLPVFSGAMQVLFLSLGSLLILKCKFMRHINSKVCGVFSGCLLILIAIVRCLS